MLSTAKLPADPRFPGHGPAFGARIATARKGELAAPVVVGESSVEVDRNQDGKDDSSPLKGSFLVVPGGRPHNRSKTIIQADAVAAEMLC